MTEPTIVAPTGEIDIATIDGFREALTAATADCASIVVDLTGVSFIDSVGLGAIADAGRSCRRGGGRLAVVAPHGTAAAVLLELTGLNQTLDVVGTLEAVSAG